MQDKAEKDPSESENMSVKAEEYLEIISTEDERIKIIGEELANDTGRAIFGKVSQGIASPNDLAKSLNISLPLINWHINRLLSVGLVKVERIEMSSKNKQMKFYGPVKTALVIIPPEETSAAVNGPKPRRESVLLKLRQYMASIIAFVAGIPAFYSIQKAANPSQTELQTTPENFDTMMKTAEPLREVQPTVPPGGESAQDAQNFATQIAPTTGIQSVSSDTTMIVIALLFAAAIAVAIFFATRFYLRKKKIIQKN